MKSARKRAEWLNAVERDWHRSLGCRYTESYAECAYRLARAGALCGQIRIEDRASQLEPSLQGRLKSFKGLG